MLLGGAGLVRASYRFNWIQIVLLWYQMYVTAHHISPYTLPKANVVMTEHAAEKSSSTLCNFYSGTILLAHKEFGSNDWGVKNSLPMHV